MINLIAKVCNFIILVCVCLGMIVTSALIIWKALMCVTGSESPVVVVLSGSMEPGFKRVTVDLIRCITLQNCLMLKL